MSNEPVTVTYSLEEVLIRLEQKIDSRFEQLEQKIDSLQQDITDVKLGQVRLEEETKTIREDVKELKTSSKAQIWTLIGILLTAVTGFLVAVGRFVFVGNP
jgi:sugar-specific transcriptional regulator TrmB